MRDKKEKECLLVSFQFSFGLSLSSSLIHVSACSVSCIVSLVRYPSNRSFKCSFINNSIVNSFIHIFMYSSICLNVCYFDHIYFPQPFSVWNR